MQQSAKLGPDQRRAALEAMSSRELDVLIVGGGVVGAGSALDAATRGLSVGIVEAHDWASGTSSRSSKLIHGGLRYLEMLDFRLVREALKERGLLLDRLAPHLVRPVPFLYPLTGHVWERAYAGSGVALYDGMSLTSGNGRGLPQHRHLTRRRCASRRWSVRSSTTTRRWTTPASWPPSCAPRSDTVRTRRTGPAWSRSCARASGSPARSCATN